MEAFYLIPMKKILFLSLFVWSVTAHAQSVAPKYNHDAFVVSNMDTSVLFFKTVLLLTEIENPANNPQIRWFSLGDSHELHLIQMENANIVPNKAHHLALSTVDITAFVNHLNQNNVPFEDWFGEKQKIQLREDGIHQIYIQDPDGHWIEINDAK